MPSLDALRAALLQALETIKALRAKQVQPPKPQPPKPPPANNLLNEMALGIQQFEGWIPPRNPDYPRGSRSFRNNNPGNLKYAGQYGTVGYDDKFFAKFETYELGFKALKDMILRAAKGGSRIYKPDMTLYDFFDHYAPASDDNYPQHYARAVAKRMNVDPAVFRIKQLL
jgi:hypothetical protein